MIIKKDFIRVNKYTRPARKLKGVKGIVLHYTASPRASAKNIRDYFDGTCIRQERYASAHIAVDEKEAIQLIPFDEVAYHANDGGRCYPKELGDNANFTTIGVEMCVDANMNITEKTFQNTVDIVVQLCKLFGLSAKNLYRHFDITGKNCPAGWVKNPKEFERFKKTVQEKLNPPKKVEPKPAPSKDYHIIQKGDTLWGISQKYNISVTQLEELNPHLKAKALQIGDKVYLKPQKYYVIQKGDTLWSIAERFKTTVAKLEALNPNIKATALQIGQKIRVK